MIKETIHVSIYDVFRKTHLKNKKEIAAAEDSTTISEKWVDSAAENFQVQYKAAYDERLNALRAEADEDVDDVPPEQQMEIFHSLAPLNAKGRAYPAGNLLDDVESGTQRRRTTLSGSSSHTYDSTTADQMTSRLIAMEEEVQRVKAQLEEERQRHEDERRRRETELFELFGQRMSQLVQRFSQSNAIP